MPRVSVERLPPERLGQLLRAHWLGGELKIRESCNREEDVAPQFLPISKLIEIVFEPDSKAKPTFLDTHSRRRDA